MAMAKFDTSTIENYDSMTPEEKLAALENYEYDDHSDAVEQARKLKEATDKATHEAAELKKQLRAEQAKASGATSEADETITELKEQLAKLQEQNEAQVKINKISSYNASLLKLGMDDDLAKPTAEALVEGDMDSVFNNLMKFRDIHDKAMKAEIMRQTPKPGPIDTNNSTGMTKEKFSKLDVASKIRFANEHPDEYVKLVQPG